MELDELLAAAKSACRLMDIEMGRDRGTLERAAQYAAIAQGYSLTAQAMIWRSLTSWTDGLPGAVLPVTRFDI